jgi:hypothetical protein
MKLAHQLVADVTKRLEKQVIDELRWGERLIWHARSASQRRKQEGWLTPKPAATLALGMLFVLSILAVVFGGPAFLIYPVSFVLLGVAIVYSLQRWSGPYRKARTMYALTDRRVFVLQHMHFRKRLRSIPLQFIAQVEVVDYRPDTRRGTVVVRIAGPEKGEVVAIPLRFFMIQGAHRIRELILQTRQERLERLDAGPVIRVRA